MSVVYKSTTRRLPIEAEEREKKKKQEKSEREKMLLCLESMQNPGNTPASFTCPLPEHFDLNTGGRGKWHISLVEITLPPIKTGKKWDS